MFFFSLILRIEIRAHIFQISDLLLSYTPGPFKNQTLRGWRGGSVVKSARYPYRGLSFFSTFKTTCNSWEFQVIWFTCRHIHTYKVRFCFEVWGYISMVEYLPSMQEALNLIFVLQKAKQQKIALRQSTTLYSTLGFFCLSLELLQSVPSPCPENIFLISKFKYVHYHFLILL